MPRHQQGNVSFEIPRHWEDKTIVAFSAPSRGGKDAAGSFVMTRDRLEETDTLASYADRQLAELGKRVDGFELLEKRELSVGGARAVSLRFASKAAAGPLVQRLVIVEDRRRAVVCFTATAPKADASQLEPLFDRMISGVRLEAPPSAEAES
ncbi:MAG: DcrB-related protein [Polyangiaceae bacterium]